MVKNRGALVTVFGQFNMRKAQSPWRDVRLRQATRTALLKLSSMHIGNRRFYAEHGWGEKHW